jgi:hypothetical protein
VQYVLEWKIHDLEIYGLPPLPFPLTSQEVAEFLPEISAKLQCDPQQPPVPGYLPLPPHQVAPKKIIPAPLASKKKQPSSESTKSSKTTQKSASKQLNPIDTTNPNGTTKPNNQKSATSQPKQPTPGMRHRTRLAEVFSAISSVATSAGVASAESDTTNLGLQPTKLAYAKDVESPEPFGELLLSEVDELNC